MKKELKSFKDDKYTIKTDDLDAIRLRPAMIIGYLGYAGVLHLCKEIIDNNRDECYKEASPGDTVDITITDDYIISRDNGRGIPIDLVRVVHETSNAGSNMTRAGGNTSGENGIGTTAYTALASKLIVISLRPQEKKKLTLEYEEGKLVSEKLEDYDGTDHGMITQFYPSEEILGVDKIPVDELVEWLKMFDYTLPSKIKMNYNVKGTQYSTKHKNLSEYFDEALDNKCLCAPLTIEADGDLVEDIQSTTFNRKFHVEACIIYASSEYKDEDIRKSWMNMIYTPQNGVHVNGVINGLTKFLSERVIKKKKQLADEDFKRDILSNLQVIVKCECDFATMFSSQAKAHVFPKIILNGITNAVYDKLCQLPLSATDDLVEVVIANNRVRKEGEKARVVSSTTKIKSTWEKPNTYIPCSSVKTKEPKELFLVEGISAGGGVRAARDARFQAILQFRGKSLNVWDATLEQTLKFGPWRDLVKVMGCGIGPTFDMKKLKFDKIIITSDADIDGYHIRVGNCIFFLKWYPEIIEAGKLYIAEPPLYELLHNKHKMYVASKRECIEACLNTISDITVEFNI